VATHPQQIPTGKLHACENCGTLRYAGSWGTEGSSGRFCKRRCAQQFICKQRLKNMSLAEIGRRISAGKLGRPLSAANRAGI
jgi:hypothetical protein